MKIRTGFVSNSSSSSFTLCVPKNSTKEEIRDILKKYLKVGKSFFLKNFESDLIDTIIKNKGTKIDINKAIKDQKRYVKEGCGTQDWVDWWQDKLDRNFDVYQGGFHSSGPPAEIFLCHNDFEIDEEDIFMENDGSY